MGPYAHLLRLDDAHGAPLALVARVQLHEGGAPAVGQPWRLVGAEEGPVGVGLHARHEEVGHPQGVKEVARARLLTAVVLGGREEGGRKEKGVSEGTPKVGWG